MSAGLGETFAGLAPVVASCQFAAVDASPLRGAPNQKSVSTTEAPPKRSWDSVNLGLAYRQPVQHKINNVHCQDP